MKRILLAVLLVIGIAHAQEVRGPFTISPPSWYAENTRIARCSPDTVELIMSRSNGQVELFVYSTVAESLLSVMPDIAAVPQGWFGETYGPVRWGNNWTIVSDQAQSNSDIDFRWNRTVLITNIDGETTSTTLDSGRTHPYWVDSLYSNSFITALFPRLDGGYFLSRYHTFAVRDSNDEFVRTEVHEMRLYTSADDDPIVWTIGCDADYWDTRYASFSSDSVILLRHEGFEFDSDVIGCIESADGSTELPSWQSCVIYPYGFIVTRDRRLLYLTGYSPIFQVRQLTLDGACEVVGETYTPAQSAFGHPDCGFALLTTDTRGISLGQIGLSGELVRPSTVVYESGELYPHMLDYTIADNGDMYFLWHEDYHVLKLLIIPWDAVLDAPEANVPSLPTNLSLSAYPNPFNSTVTISYELPTAGDVKLTAYDLQGRLVSTISDEFAPAGTRELRWSPENLASGVYFLNLEAALTRTTHKVLYLK